MQTQTLSLCQATDTGHLSLASNGGEDSFRYGCSVDLAWLTAIMCAMLDAQTVAREVRAKELLIYTHSKIRLLALQILTGGTSTISSAIADIPLVPKVPAF